MDLLHYNEMEYFLSCLTGKINVMKLLSRNLQYINLLFYALMLS